VAQRSKEAEMKEEKIVRAAIASMFGCAHDNAQRARHAFAGKNMDEQHGESGRTRAEILNDYEEHEHDCKRALEWFEEIVRATK
jgi:hypothetical protein